MDQMLLLLRRSVAAFPLEVCYGSVCPLIQSGTQDHTVWGVIWLIQAIIMFAVGVIVGLVAFKVGVICYDIMLLAANVI
jgi:hypothetical protein